MDEPTTPDGMDDRPATSEVDGALLDLKYVMSRFLFNTANDGETWELIEQLDEVNSTVIDTHQAAGGTELYQGWGATDASLAPDS